MSETIVGLSIALAVSTVISAVLAYKLGQAKMAFAAIKKVLENTDGN